jgi:oligopeptidase B
MAEGHAYFHLTVSILVKIINLLVLGVDTVSRRQYNIQIKNLKQNEIFFI